MFGSHFQGVWHGAQHGKGKTEVVPLLAEPGSAAVSMAAVNYFSRGIVCPDAKGGPVVLACSKIYRHMGHRTMATGSIMPEIAMRYASAKDAMRQLRSPFCRKTSVQACDKVNVASSLILSRQFTGAGCWPALRTVERQRIHSNVMFFFFARRSMSVLLPASWWRMSS